MSYLRTCKRGRARFGPTLLRRLLLYCEGGSKSPLLQALLVRVLKFQFLTAHRNVAGVKDAWVSFFHVHQVQYHLGSIRPCLGNQGIGTQSAAEALLWIQFRLKAAEVLLWIRVRLKGAEALLWIRGFALDLIPSQCGRV
jgi:hypothetical protein